MQPSNVNCEKRNPSKTDIAMKKIWHTLRQDFSASLGFKIGTTPSTLIDNDIASFRDYQWPNRQNHTPYHMKCEYQLENLLKRYRFTYDKFSDDDLANMQVNKQISEIVRLSTLLKPSTLVFKILQRARYHMKRILGEYDEEEHLSCCRFGKRSSVGSPYRKSYLDLKLKAPFEASPGQVRWFKHYLSKDPILANVVCKARPKGVPMYKTCTHLTSTNVPKSFKSYRGITPNTTIGTFYTYGLGKVLALRLRKEGLNINTLQQRHGVLAKKFSRSRTHATADLSAASDSITIQLLMYLVPRKWLSILKMGQIRNVKIGGEIYNTPTFCGMGIGYTFPLETLVFYCLLEAVRESSGTKGFVSVYGDDLIYPSAMHKYVRVIFPQINLQINEDKTFVEQNFRESCGSDFYHGIDVRPVSPAVRNGGTHPLAYSAFIYQIVNSLQRKWNPSEIPSTMYYLKKELMNTTDAILVVPPSYPDFAGWRCDTPAAPKAYKAYPLEYLQKRIPLDEWPVVFREPKFYIKRGRNITQSWVFSYLTKEVKDRVVDTVYPYYWDTMRTMAGVTQAILKDKYSFFTAILVKTELDEFVRDIVDEMWDNPVDSTSLRWRAVKPAPKNYRSRLTGQRLKQLEAVVQLKVEQRTLATHGAIGEWC